VMVAPESHSRSPLDTTLVETAPSEARHEVLPNTITATCGITSLQRALGKPSISEHNLGESSPFKRSIYATSSDLGDQQQTPRSPTAAPHCRQTRNVLLSGRVGSLTPRQLASCTRPVSATTSVFTSHPPVADKNADKRWKRPIPRRWNADKRAEIPALKAANSVAHTCWDPVDERQLDKAMPPATARSFSHRHGYKETRAIYINDKPVSMQRPTRRGWNADTHADRSRWKEKLSDCPPSLTQSGEEPSDEQWYLQLFPATGRGTLATETFQERANNTVEIDPCVIRTRGYQMTNGGPYTHTLEQYVPPLNSTAERGGAKHCRKLQVQVETVRRKRAQARARTACQSSRRVPTLCFLSRWELVSCQLVSSSHMHLIPTVPLLNDSF